ncbi:MAG: hypothetical protein R3Y13_01545 [bacterium]
MKIFILIILVLICSGCNAQYTVFITDEFNEKITLYFDEDNYNADYIPYTYGETGPTDIFIEEPEGDFYEMQADRNNNVVVYTHEFDKSSFLNSNAANTCYKIFLVTNEDGIYNINTNSTNKCFDDYPDLDKITIKIYDYENRVVSANAERISNSYTYVFTRDNRFYADIELSIDYTDKESTNNSTPNGGNNSDNYLGNESLLEDNNVNQVDSPSNILVIVTIFSFFVVVVLVIISVKK